MAERPGHRAYGHRVFFPAALLHAVLLLPYWTAGHLGWIPTAWTPAVHAHEMLMGYALAVVGGFLLTRPSRRALALALAAWIAGRAAVLAGLPPAAAIPATLAFPVVLFVLAGWPFLRSAKSGHNAVFGPLVGAFVLAEVLYWTDGRSGVLLALHLVGLMLFTMGGRIIPAATAGAIRRQGGLLVERVQPRLEVAGIAGGAVAALSAAGGLLPELGAAGAVVTGLAAWARLARWRTGAVLRQPDVWPLHLGYAWLGLGWIGAGLELVLPGLAGAGWHALGVGALGTLTTTMMVRATRQREALPTELPPAALAAVALVSVAALLRIGAAWTAPIPLLTLAALAWTAAHLLVLGAIRVRSARS